MQERTLIIDANYMQGLLDARGMPSDDATTQKALAAWISHLQSEEDNVFSDVMAYINITATE